MEIKEINVSGVDIPDITIVDPRNYSSPPIPLAPPVVVNIGVPVVDIPGCVEAHESNNKSKTVGQDDKAGLVTYCDSGIPSYNPINFEPEQIIPTAPAGVDTREKEKPEPPGQVELPQAAPPATAKVDCPTPAQVAKEPVGTYVEGFRKKVTEYKLIGNECVQITEKVPLPQQIVAGLPSGGQVVQVGGIAVIATSSALLAKPLADLLLKAVKPAVKKVMKKIAAVRGKKLPVLSVGERQAEQRQMNHAVKELRSVFPRKKKSKG
ncbi:hypothetical protein [Synechococcus phage S-H9-2]|uniref:Uncharacterized protein n=1 Tax=Synechococcus phage S-H9-2 TaxID=2783669 RepID=A0A873WG48_9CAUD|nr:hypothetical protein PQC10_gp099 [Synechococcus phage S-H9-2]QPB08376.1 hypothetical protein [Synechococcus phage S-H9-2]